MLRIAHVSDTHGFFIPIQDRADIIIHSGDFLANDWPNLMPDRHGKPQGEIWFQKEYILRNAEVYKSWIKDRPFFICNGNHDFIDSVPVLKSIGINAIDITERLVSYEQLNIYGFPFIPFMGGRWNYELYDGDMADKVEQLGHIIEDNHVDILVAHCPPHGILDFTDVSHGSVCIGNSYMTNAFNYRWAHLPSLYLTGHVHEAAGISQYKEMLIVNSATKSTLIEM